MSTNSSSANAPVTPVDLWRNLNKARRAFADMREEDVEIATTPKEEIARDGTTRLYRYKPLVEYKARIPVLLAYALVGRYTVADLQPDRSLVRNLLELGLDVYVIDWGHPREVDRNIDLEDYIEGFIHDYVDVIRARAKVDKVNLLGICQGGIFHTCFAALHPDKVNTVVSMVAPFDCHANAGDEQVDRGLIHFWAGALDASDIDDVVDNLGTMDGDAMAQAFGLMTPASTMLKYGLNLTDIANNPSQMENFLRMERWLSDRPAHTAASFRQWIKDFYIDNKLVNGEFRLGDALVDLQNVRCPVLNVYGEHDVIAPPVCTRALKDVIGSDDYSELSFPGGHIGIFVGKRAQRDLSPAVADWIIERSQ